MFTPINSAGIQQMALQKLKKTTNFSLK